MQKLKAKHIFLSIIIAALCFTCKKENRTDCLKSTGKIVIQKRELSNFKMIVLEDKIDLFITQDSIFKVEVEAGENLQSLIKTVISGDTLKIQNTLRCNWVRGYNHRIKIYVSAPYYAYINNLGVGQIQSTNTITQNEIRIKCGNVGDMTLKINADEITFGSHGGGDIYLSGNTKRLIGDFVGTNYIYAKELTVLDFIYLNAKSIGNAYVKAPENGTMDIRLNRDGNVYYTGSPKSIESTRVGKGQLIKE